ncbi:uroporphyrinogen-III synthase [Chitinophaga rhizophila]|uniref:Uroporphyrinogen-III synthase n=1 Tax=Chitinophaga rhizophila TaxID=2866212 RepID=A0ABS7GBM5_9BACT|nr:uroporphyrinogen-III synthase [Chitinophaga rhizophila]MBW8685068.1 uroporphyrinogen-III synthase [Chitinophaga rhizophila]
MSTKTVSQELISFAASHNVDIDAQPFISITPLVTDALKLRVHQLLRQMATVVFTSANAVSAIQDHYLSADGKYYYGDWLSFPPDTPAEQIEAFRQGGFYTPGWKVYCLEGATLKAVSTSGIRHDIIATANDATALARQIVLHEETGHVAFFCGDRRRDDLPAILAAHGIMLDEIIIYSTTETPVSTEKQYDGVFFLSPSAVQSFFSVNSLPPHTICFSIGHTTAKALEAYTSNKIIISTSQRIDDMVQTAINYFNNIN